MYRSSKAKNIQRALCYYSVDELPGFPRVWSQQIQGFSRPFKADFSRFSRPLMTRPGAVVTVVHYENVARWQDCITFYQSRVIQHSPAAKFMCTQSGGQVGGKYCRKFKDFRKFQSRFKDFQGPFYDFQGPQATLTIFKAIPGLEFNSRLFKAFKAPRKPWFHSVQENPLLPKCQ